MQEEDINWLFKLTNKHEPRLREADIYGVILYSQGNPHVKMLLDDDDYWKALDEWSGPQWAIFATRVEKGTIGWPDSPPGFMSYMVSVWKEPLANKILLEAFEIESTQELPILLVFAKTDTGEILKRAINITESSVEEAALSLKQTMATVSNALQNVTDENLRNTLGVYSAISLALDHANSWQTLKRSFKLWQRLRSVI